MKYFSYQGKQTRELSDNEAITALFNEICTCEDYDIIDNNNIMFVKYPEPVMKKLTSYKLRKEALCEFAKEWQRSQAGITSSYDDLSWWSSFFEKYGKKYGLLTEFRANGIC